jgi:Holliday junction DNA helicase RuvA
MMMIYYVSGPVTVLEPGLAVVDCGGVGYGCRVTAYTAAQLKLDKPAKLYITESIREDAHDLYGFISREEQRCYELLTSVTGVGPKAAMAILSSGGPQNFTLAVMTGDEKMLTAAQGIGKKIAQRIILELKDKIGGGAMELDFSTGPAVAAPAQSGNNAALATAALQELGYSQAEIAAALKGVDANASTEDMVRHALRAMVMKG